MCGAFIFDWFNIKLAMLYFIVNTIKLNKNIPLQSTDCAITNDMESYGILQKQKLGICIFALLPFTWFAFFDTNTYTKEKALQIKSLFHQNMWSNWYDIRERKSVLQMAYARNSSYQRKEKKRRKEETTSL